MLVNSNKEIWDKESFSNEAELEDLVYANFEQIWGDNSLIFKKENIKTDSGSATIPDAFVIDLEDESWYLVEVELLHHGVYRHIVPQVTKQINASINPSTRTLLRQRFLAQIQNNEEYKEKFVELEIPEIKISEVLDKILNSRPKISIPIDQSNEDLENWASSLMYEVEIKEITKFKSRTSDEYFFEFPDLEATAVLGGSRNPAAKPEYYKYTGRELISLLVEYQYLSVGEELNLIYKKKTYNAVVCEDGDLELKDGYKKSASLCGIHIVKAINPKRNSVNGLKAWRNSKGESLSNFRKKMWEDDLLKVA